MKMGCKSKHWTGKLNEKQIGFFARPCDPNVLLLLSIQLGKSAFSKILLVYKLKNGSYVMLFPGLCKITCQCV